jgi:hypothetical protein
MLAGLAAIPQIKNSSERLSTPLIGELDHNKK